ncbi:MAG: tryptophan halogenase [Lysobacterales bacterium]
MSKIKQIVIVGGGTAGWMAAAALSKTFGRNIEITLIESDAIATVGVGEATIPAIKNFHLLLELDEAEFMRAVHGTFKLGIEFENWGNLGEHYFHPFGPPGVDAWAAQFHHYWLKTRQQGVHSRLGDFSLETSMARAEKFAIKTDPAANYAYHFDAGLYAQFLRQFSEKLGVDRTEGKVVKVNSNPESGFIESVTLESGQSINGQLFIDCSGFRGLLIEQELKTGWEDWSHWLRCDSAAAVQTETVSAASPYTRSTARSCGWQWKIPLQHRVGNGLVYSSKYMSDEEAKKMLLDNIDGKPLADVRTLKFRTGRRLKQWNKNCIALGLASGFMEPLESTSIHLIQNSIIRLIKLFPVNEIIQSEVDQFNHDVKIENEYIRDFIILHYHATQRGDTPFWTDCRDMEIPETLAHKMRLFKANGRVFREQNELFAERSWAAVMLGQGLIPDGYHPFVDNLSDQELNDFMAQIRASVMKIVGQLPTHHEFVDQYCKAPGLRS